VEQLVQDTIIGRDFSIVTRLVHFSDSFDVIEWKPGRGNKQGKHEIYTCASLFEDTNSTDFVLALMN